MFLARALLLLTLVPVLASADLMINEIRTDQPGGDVDEYIEFYIDGSLSTTIDDYSLIVIGDGGTGDGTVEEVFSFTGLTSTADGSFILFHESTLTLGTGGAETVVGSLAFENSDNLTFLLVTGSTASAGDDLDTDDDGVLDVTPWTSVIDAVAMIEEDNPPAGTEFHYIGDVALGGIGTAVGPDAGSAPGHIFRDVDGTGSWSIGAFDTVGGDDTAGFSNVAVPEPSSFALFGALGALAAVRRRRSAK